MKLKNDVQKWLTTMILRLTHRMWNRRISRILCHAYDKRIINSLQLHELTARFDPTQPRTCEVYK